MLSGSEGNAPAEGLEVSEVVSEVMNEEDEVRTPPLAPHCGPIEAVRCRPTSGSCCCRGAV